MDIEARLAAIEEAQDRILQLLVKKDAAVAVTMTLREAAEYVGYSSHHFRRLAVEQRMIPFSRPSGQQKGKLLFRRTDLDSFLDQSTKQGKPVSQRGRKRKSKEITYW